MQRTMRLTTCNHVYRYFSVAFSMNLTSISPLFVIGHLFALLLYFYHAAVSKHA
jgi:hypothetical protein